MELIGRKHKLLAGAAAVAMALLTLGSIAALSDHYALRHAPPVEVAGKRPIPCGPPHRAGAPAHRVRHSVRTEVRCEPVYDAL